MKNILDIEKIRTEFQVLNQNNKQFIYFDNASTTLKPNSVINKLNEYYLKYPVNIHRSIYDLGIKATDEFEKVRDLVKNLINANSKKNIIFTKSTTESINLVAYSWGRKFLCKNDEILLSKMEHHSNIVPWQLCAEATGAKVKYIPITENGEFDLSNIDKLINHKTKIVSIIHQSNVFGTINPINQIIKKAKKFNAITLIDAAQSVPHIKIDVNDIECDFLVFSGHKMLGPTGVGVLYGNEKILEIMDPFLSGGQMINQVKSDGSSFAELPYKFEAGTPNIAQVIGLGESINFISSIGYKNIIKYENNLTEYALNKLKKLNEVCIYGHSNNRGSVISFNIDGIHSLDLAQFLNHKGISIRAGHHCAQPLMKDINLNSTARISFYFYNTLKEIDYFIKSIKDAIIFFNR